MRFQLVLELGREDGIQGSRATWSWRGQRESNGGLGGAAPVRLGKGGGGEAWAMLRSGGLAG